ncbi:HlyD family secretion protein [Tabrizicola sp. BL-A-41-H6]|uniref:HlyD family secretion protein n=1 Tax=Tabrizicola sp. BL-A-41-H6 TaxID=3421107 RepID=UPI003D66AEDC
MLELTLCSMLTILPDYLYRRFAQGKRFGHEITLFTVWYELRWGITLCLMLTVTLITTIFYFHPATTAVNSVFRTVTILPETSGRVAETFVESNQRVKKGDPLFKLDDSEQKAEVQTAQARLAEQEAARVGVVAQLAQAEAGIAQARAQLRQAQDEYNTRADLFARNSGAIPKREVEQALVRVQAQEASLAASEATRDAVQAQLDIELPARLTTVKTELAQAQVALDRTLVVAGTDGIVQQFALRPGDVVNPMLRPAGILVPDRRVTGLMAGFGQIEAGVMKVGMIGEVTCLAKPLTIIPMVVTEIQDVIASGQVRATDQLVGVEQFSKPGTITVLMEPLYEGQLDGLPQGSNCIANAYTSNYEALQDPDISSFHAFVLHAIDATGLVHGMILRMQALMLPMQNLVFKGH